MSKSINIVKPSYNYDNELLKILIVCESCIERRSIGQTMVDLQDGKHYGIHVHLRRCLPISDKYCDEHFDFIVFVIDPKTETSLKTVQDSLEFVDLEFFFGKCCFVVLHDDSEICLKSEIEQLESFYRTSALYANCSNKNEQKDLASQILTKAEISNGIDSFVQHGFH